MTLHSKLTALAAVLAAGLSWNSSASALELIFGHGLGPGNPRYEAAERFKQIVEERTDGRITIQHAAQATQGDDMEMLTALRLGTMAFSANAQGPVSTIVPEFAAIGLPFLFESLPQAWTVLDGPIGEELAEKARAQGLEVIAFWDNGIRYVTNNKRPINAPEDLSGLKLRTPPAPMTVDIFQALGANPEPLAFSELYMALQQGVFDGQENPAMNIYGAKLHEVQKYLSKTGHIYEATPVVASKIVWDSLPEEDRKILREAAVEAGRFQRDLVQSSNQEFLDKLAAEGMEINDVDPAPFKEATTSVYDKWEGQIGDIVPRIRQAAQEAATQ